MRDDGRNGCAILEQGDETAGLREGFARREPGICCSITRTGDAAETEMPPRMQKRLLLIHPIAATTAVCAV